MDKAITRLIVPNPQAQDSDLAGVYKEINPDLIKLLKEGGINPKPLMLCSGGTSTRCATDKHWTLDLREKYRSIHFEDSNNEVLIEGGVNMKELIQRLSKENRSFPIGLSGITGIGYILTGGISPLSRKYGLAIDNILEIKGIWGNGNYFKISKPVLSTPKEDKVKWRALCGAAPFLAIVTSLKLETQIKKPIYVWESILSPKQLANVIIDAEDWPYYASLYWSWQENIKVYGIFEIDDISNTKEIGLLMDRLPKTIESKKYIIPGLLELPPLTNFSKNLNLKDKKYSEVLGLLGNKWKDDSHEIIKELTYLMKNRPNKNCSISSQQLGGYTSEIPRERTSFIHRDSAWKPWITASWNAEDNDSKERSLKWLENAWEALEPKCPGIHLAQFHHHLSWHKKETKAAFNNWISSLQKLKSAYDPKEVLPSL